MKFNYKSLPNQCLVENGQGTQSHYCIVNLDNDQKKNIIPLTDIFKCRDYMHDTYDYSLNQRPFKIYGFDNEMTKDWDGQQIMFFFGYRDELDADKSRDYFDGNIEQLNKLLTARGFPTINYCYVENWDPKKTNRSSIYGGTSTVGDSAIIVDTEQWMQSLLLMSTLTGLLRVMTTAPKLMPKIEFGRHLTSTKSEAIAFKMITEEYLWEVMGKYVKTSAGNSASAAGLELLKGKEDDSYKDIIHNSGGLRSLFNNVRPFGFLTRYDAYYLQSSPPIDAEEELPFTPEDLADVTKCNMGNFKMNDVVATQMIEAVVKTVPAGAYEDGKIDKGIIKRFKAMAVPLVVVQTTNV